jgi:hypothetical protein
MSEPHSIPAALALVQAAAHPQPDYGIADGCIYIEGLRAGMTFLRSSACVTEPAEVTEARGHHLQYHRPVTVLRDAEPDTTSDPFGRELVRFWCRDDLTGNEGWMSFGPGGAVRIEAADWCVVLTEDVTP